MDKIIIFCEYDFDENKIKDSSYELISKAHELKKNARELLKDENYNYLTEAVVLADEIAQSEIEKAYKTGADRLVLIKNPIFKNFDSIIYSKAFVEYYNQNTSPWILFSATPATRMTAPMITTLLNTGLVADCTGIDFALKDSTLKLAPTRPTFGAELMATILSKKDPQCATIRPKTFEIKYENNKEGEFLKFDIDIKETSKIKTLSTIINKEEDSYFKDAKIVLACGFGISGDNGIYYKKVEKLAQKLGAKIASSRKAVDYNYMPHKYQIGQSGENVAADLYIAFGISGAIQHICAMKNSKTIISINTDENSEIFKYSDYKIVADAKKIIDELCKRYSIE